MSRTVSRRIAASAAAVAVAAGGTFFALGAGAGVASAADACGTKATKTVYSVGNLIGIELTKEVVGSAEVAPGGAVTYKTTVKTVKGTSPLIGQIGDYYPAGFTLQSATINGNTAIPANNTDTHVASVARTPGWNINDGNTATYTTTYQVPSNAVPGAVYDSGASVSPDLFGEQKWNPIGVCVTVRNATVGESATGSLDMAGLGSSDLDLSPEGILAGILVNGLPTGSSN